MNSKFVYLAIALGLMLAYLLPVVIKLKELPLALVILLGLGMMAYDGLQSLKDKDD